MVGHIFIYGEIDAFYGVNTASIQQQMKETPSADKYIVHINSIGGSVYEGWAIHDILINSGKEIQTQIEGICASIATIPFLAGSTRLISPNSELMIHNPFTMGQGTASDLEKQAEQLREIEDKISAYYSLKTGMEIEALKSMMTSETFINADEAVSLGFATGLHQNIKAVAKLTPNINPKNETMKLNNEDKNWFESMFDKVFSKFGAKSLMIADADGKNLDFGDQIEAEDQIAVGMTAKFGDGTIPTGEVVLPSGLKLIFDNGTVTEIIAVQEAPDQEMEALKQENENLKSEIEALKAAQAAAPKLEDIKASLKSEFQMMLEERVSTEKTAEEEKQFQFKGKKPKTN